DRRRAALRHLRRDRAGAGGGARPREPGAHHRRAADARRQDPHGAGADALAAAALDQRAAAGADRRAVAQGDEPAVRPVASRSPTYCKVGPNAATEEAAMTRSRLLVLAVLIAGIGAFFAFGGHELLRPDNLKSLLARVQEHFQAKPAQTGFVFFLAY